MELLFVAGVASGAAWFLLRRWDRRREANARIQRMIDELPAGPSTAEMFAQIEAPIIEKVRERQDAMGSAWAQLLEMSTPEGQRAATRRQAARPFRELSEREQDQRIEHHQATVRRLAKARREGSLARW